LKKIIARLLPKIIGTQINTISIWSKRAAARKAFLVFCTPRGGRIKEDQKEFLESAKDQRIKVNDAVTVQTYRWEGSGPTVLLIHGWESNAHRWFKLVEELQRKNYTVIAFDAPGHGNSTGKLLNVPLYTESVELVSNLYKPEVHIGHSIGGLTNVYHYYKHTPEHIKKLVILGAASDLAVIMKDYQRLLGMKNRVMTALDQLIQQRFGFSIDEFSGYAFAKAIDVPGLIIHDQYDKITPVAASRGIHKNWKNSTYIETTGLGHSLYQDEVRNHILKFIEL
jgi:pimeloyl-ACP methyl ester carboxylesterase